MNSEKEWIEGYELKVKTNNSINAIVFFLFVIAICQIVQCLAVIK